MAEINNEEMDNDVNEIGEFINRANVKKQTKMSNIRKVKDTWKKQFCMSEQKGNQYLEGDLLMDVYWRMITKARPLDFIIKNESIDEIILLLIRAAVAHILKQGGYSDSLLGFYGGLSSQFLYGNSYIRFGTGKDLPLVFEITDIENVYFDPCQKTFRGARGAKQHAIDYWLTKEELKKNFPEFQGEVEIGDIDFSENYDNYKNESEEDQKKATNSIKVIEFWDISQEKHIVIAGADKQVIKKQEKKAYTWRDIEGNAVIPGSKRGTFPDFDGPYEYGIGEYYYRLHITDKKIDNMGISSAYDRIDPISMIPMGSGTVKDFFKKLKKAQLARSQGKKAPIPIETDIRGRQDIGKIQSIQGESMPNEFERLGNRVGELLRRRGINLDDISHPSSDTARHAVLRDEVSSAIIRQFQEFNAPEDQFVVYQALKALHDYVDINDDTSIGGKIEVPRADGSIITLDDIARNGQMGQKMTLGIAAQQIRELGLKSFCVEMDMQSGAYPSISSQIGRIDEMLPGLNPESRGYKKLYVERGRLLGKRLSMEDISAAPPPQQQAQQQQAPIAA